MVACPSLSVTAMPSGSSGLVSSRSNRQMGTFGSATGGCWRRNTRTAVENISTPKVETYPHYINLVNFLMPYKWVLWIIVNGVRSDTAEQENRFARFFLLFLHEGEHISLGYVSFPNVLVSFHFLDAQGRMKWILRIFSAESELLFCLLLNLRG